MKQSRFNSALLPLLTSEQETIAKQLRRALNGWEDSFAEVTHVIRKRPELLRLFLATDFVKENLRNSAPKQKAKTKAYMKALLTLNRQ